MKPLLALVGVLLVCLPWADRAAAHDHSWVAVGEPGNACDPQPQGCFGAVGDTFLVSPYELTNAEYVGFLNAVDPAGTNALELFHPAMASDPDNGGISAGGPIGAVYTVKPGFAEHPVVYVSVYDALRYANWMHNGQSAGDTETGAYTLLGGTPVPSNGTILTRNAGAQVFVPTEDEWYKAAYYAGSDTYTEHPAGSDLSPVCDLPAADTGNTANCDLVIGTLSATGAYPQTSNFSGTYDQAGNVAEWNETIIAANGIRGVRGGAWVAAGSVGMAASERPDGFAATTETSALGFRVATLASGTACSDGVDNDGDGRFDYSPTCATAQGASFDCGCSSLNDTSETDATGVYDCDDGFDNDGDGATDLADPACPDPLGRVENPKCQDGLENDGDGRIDFDGGQSIHGACGGGSCPPGVSDVDLDGIADPDPQCVGKPSRNREGSGCGLGFELALLIPMLGGWRRWRRRPGIREGIRSAASS